MKRCTALCLCGSCLIALAGRPAQAEPPFSGTIFISPDIITPADPTTFQGLTYAGQGFRLMFDRRVNDWTFIEAYLFDATFDDGLAAEIQVNPEFGSVEAAQVAAEQYAPVIGQLPTVLRTDLETVWIHQGTEPFGGGNNNLLIHTGQADLYVADGILEEVLVHEAAHTSLDADHAAAPGWLDAQAADGEFISVWARDFPEREDIAESFLPWLAVRHRLDRISESLADTILETIPNRLAYFDAQPFDLYPIVAPAVLSGDANRDGRVDGEDFLIWQANFGMQSGAAWEDGDFNGDGRVDGEDFLIWQANFGTMAANLAAAAVPEPGVLGLLAAGLLMRRGHRPTASPHTRGRWRRSR